MDLKSKASEFEKKAKIAKNKNDYNKAARLHRSAAEIYNQIGDKKNSKWNFANYYSLIGTEYSLLNKFDEARESFKKAEGLFLELGLYKPALHCGSDYIRTFIFEKKFKQKTHPQLYLEKAELFLEKYKHLSNNICYIESQIDFYKRKSIKYRLEGKYELAENWTKKCCRLAKQAYIKFKKESFRDAASSFEHMYWNLRAKRYESEKNFKNAAECYKNSAEVVVAIDKKVAIDEYINYYKCLAIVNKYNENIFKEKIDKAIKLAEETKDEKQKYYLLGFKYDHLVKFTKYIEKRIEFLKQAKENYYRAGEKNLGKTTEYILFYNLSKKELKDGNYKISVNLLNKSINYAKYAKFPNMVPSLNILKYEKYIHKAYLYLSKGQFSDALNNLNRWLQSRKELENTKRYKFYENLKHCCLMLSKDYFSKEDLFNIEKILQLVRQNKLGIELYKICSLVYSLISLWVHNIKDKKILEKIKLEITRRITTTEAAKDLEHRFEIQRAIEKREWLLRLPQIFVEKFDYCLYILRDALDEFKYTAYREFYILLESFLKIIVEFNAKILWHDDWKKKLEEKVTDTQKSFEKYTFGDIVKSLKVLKSHNVKFLKSVSDNIFDLLNKHINIRNNISHELINKDIDFNIIEDTSKIMFSFLRAFPTCIKIINTKKMPWYNVEIIWGQLPKRVDLYSNKKLDRGYYYTDPLLKIAENKTYPRDIIVSSLSYFSDVRK